MKFSVFTITMSIFLLSIISCSTNMLVNTTMIADLSGINEGIIINAGIIYETISTGAMSFTSNNEVSSYSNALCISATESLLSRGVNCTIDSLNLSKFGIKKRNLILYKLSRGIIDPAIIDQISTLGTKDDVAILGISIYIKIGEEGTWDPFSGAITSNASNTTLRAAIIHCKTGKILWQNEIFIRSTFDSSSNIFREAAKNMFSTLASKSNK